MTLLANYFLLSELLDFYRRSNGLLRRKAIRRRDGELRVMRRLSTIPLLDQILIARLAILLIVCGHFTLVYGVRSEGTCGAPHGVCRPFLLLLLPS